MLATHASAQVPQAMVKLKTGAVQQGIITSVSASGIALQLGGGQSATFAMNIVDSVQMAAPTEYNQALQAIAQKDSPKAGLLMQAVAIKYKGLPTAWAEQATAQTGYLALQTGNVAKAELAFNDFKAAYPTSNQADIGLAAVAASKKDFATAREKIAPVIEAALKEKSVPPASRYAYSRAFLVSGQVKEADGNKSGALEDYLRTITIFFHDPTAVASAQERADALRKEKVTVP